MQLFAILICAAVLCGAEGKKKCRSHCNEVYTPVCGHDHRLGYNTFCSQDALDKCNMNKKNNYTKIADGPCYPSVREWRTPVAPLVDSTEPFTPATADQRTAGESASKGPIITTSGIIGVG